ncbi:hypothetical protein HYS00_03980 [Candidatus Microgenomates bacterium]|nr:hypothetical protein [Candidatus Microgenomates bacterium]
MHTTTSLFKFKQPVRLKQKVQRFIHPLQRIEDLGREKEAIDKASSRASDTHKMNDLIRKSNRSIASISSMFPWDLFPNTIDVEESRITFIFRQFLASQSHSLDIKDISNIFIETSLFFATLQIVARTFVQNDIKIGHLNKKDATEIRTIIEGLRTLNENQIDTSNYQITELLSKIHELHAAETLPS